MASVADIKPPRRLVFLPRPRAIRMIRARYGVTLQDIARAIKRDKTYVCDILNGKRLSRVVPHEIAAFFGVPIDELFQEVDLEKPHQASAA